jgi:orotate phosphoribosyltransferase
VRDRVAGLLPIRKGHFRLESGHHGDTWMDLEMLFLLPEAIRPFAAKLAKRLQAHGVEVVCGPLVEGSFVALLVAAKLGVPFTYSERIADDTLGALFTARYRIPGALTQVVRGKRVAIVNDVVNAGSAVRGTFAHLMECGAKPVAVAALAVLGGKAAEFADTNNVALETLTTLPNDIWAPDVCPLCKANVPLDN